MMDILGPKGARFLSAFSFSISPYLDSEGYLSSRVTNDDEKSAGFDLLLNITCCYGFYVSTSRELN